MKFAFLIIFLPVLFFPDLGACYHVENAENCKPHKGEAREIPGIIGNVIMGERPFITLFRDNGEEFILLAEDVSEVELFRKNQGKKALVMYQPGSFLFSENFLDHGIGECETIFYLKSAKIME